MQKIIDLTGRRILVIGGSSGIGKQTAITMSEIGAHVILTSNEQEQLTETLKELSGEGHSAYYIDVTDLNGIDGCIKQIVDEQGLLDGMVYSAGITDHLPLKLLKPERALFAFKVNFFGYVEAIRAITKKGRFNPGMRIVGVSSIAAIKGDKSHTSYSASKAAMDGAIRCIAKELADKQICINNVAPGMTATPMYDRFIERNGEDDETLKILLERQYLGVVQPHEVADAITFLISPAARPITGTVLYVDAGVTTN